MSKAKQTLFVLFLGAAFLAVFFNPLSSQESAGDIFERALFLEEGKGELEKAIELYKEILDKYSDIRDVAAKAQLHLGFCYEKLGLREAQTAFQNVIKNYPEQREVVRIARQKLSRLLRAKAILEKGDEELRMRKLLIGKSRDFLGAPSPDGQYISTVNWESGDLAIQKISNGKKQRLTQKKSWDKSVEYAFYSRWSPDGEKVVYSWFNEDNIFDLRIIGLDGSSARIIYRNKETTYVQPYDWSPDGSLIVAGLGEKINSIPDRLAMISVLNGSVRILKEGRIDAGFFSPDGNFVAYNYLPEGNSHGNDIHLIPVGGGTETPIIQHPAHDSVLGWEPDGQRLLFVSDRTGTMDIWMIKVINGILQGKPELLKKNMGRISGLGFTEDGSLYYTISAGMEDVYLASLEYENNSLLAPPENATEMFIGANRSPDWSPDGKSIAFISERSFRPGRLRPQVLCILNVESGEQHEFTPELKFLDLIRWSPLGSTLLVSGVDHENRRGLFSVDAQTGKSELVLEVQSCQNIFDFDWLPDGKSIVYKRYCRRQTETSNMDLIVRDIQAREEIILYHKEQVGESHHLALSTNGEWLAFDDRDPLIWTLNVIPVSGGKPEELMRTNPEESIPSIDWKPESKEIFFVKSVSGTPNQLWRVHLEEKEPQRFELTMKALREWRFHPDGLRAAFTAGPSAKTELWTIENLFLIGKAQNNSH